jgi:rhamnogalacturonyl hydrolase YesR
LTNAVDRSATSGDVDVARFARVVETLDRKWSRAGDASFDPYDGLLYSRLPKSLREHRWTRLALVQWHKRLPFNTRPLFGIVPTRNAYAVGQLASAAIRMWAAGLASEAMLASLDERLAWLKQSRVSGGWAYPFEVQTKTNHYPSSLPNVISTVFAGRAFLDATSMMKDDAGLEVAVDAAAFMRRNLWSSRGGYFSYHHGEEALIHNANILAADFVIHVGALTDDAQMVDQGLTAVETSMRCLRDDGSLLYGTGPTLGWVDGHHTGFVIESLYRMGAALSDQSFENRLRMMTDFYRARLFGHDGCPFQRPGRRYPIDAIAGAQAIKTFALLGDVAFASSVAQFMFEAMRRRDGGFLYHRGRWHRKRVPYLRWADAPMCDALATLVLVSGGTR